MTDSGNQKLQHITLDWAVEPNPTFNDAVYEAFQIEKIGWRGRQIRITGQCPYCFGDFTHVHSLKLVPSVVAPSGQGSGAIDVTVTCSCEYRHTGAPDSVTGCGQSWTIEITR